MNNTSKTIAAAKAAEYIKDGMIVGIGTGSTVKPLIEIINERVETQNLQIKAVATSIESKHALHPKIEYLDESLEFQCDICIDGADKASKEFDLIKGGGGALLREKLVAINSKFNITIVDESKIASPLSDHPLPVEIVAFGHKSTIQRLESAGFTGSLRGITSTPFHTDNHNYIYDIELNEPLLNPQETHAQLKAITGVVETGLFLKTSDIIIIGKNDHSVDVWKRG